MQLKIGSWDGGRIVPGSGRDWSDGNVNLQDVHNDSLQLVKRSVLDLESVQIVGIWDQDVVLHVQLCMCRRLLFYRRPFQIENPI